MRLPLERLDGRTVADLDLTVDEQATKASPHPVQIAATHEGTSWALFEGRTNPGTSWRHPWLEIRYNPWVGGDPEDPPLSIKHQVELFEALGESLLPGAYVMLSCDGHPDSLRALTVDVPPPCTVLGYLLWRAGARWYKVWYYPEGWREGHEKVQGNVPTDEEHAAKRTGERLEEIEAFLDTDLAEDYPACAKRGQRLIDAHGEPG